MGDADGSEARGGEGSAGGGGGEGRADCGGGEGECGEGFCGLAGSDSAASSRGTRPWADRLALRARAPGSSSCWLTLVAEDFDIGFARGEGGCGEGFCGLAGSDSAASSRGTRAWADRSALRARAPESSSCWLTLVAGDSLEEDAHARVLTARYQQKCDEFGEH